jgi:hypothetical protein
MVRKPHKNVLLNLKMVRYAYERFITVSFFVISCHDVVRYLLETETQKSWSRSQEG